MNYDIFYKSKIKKIDLDIGENSQINEENFEKLKEERLIDQEKLQELINKIKNSMN